MFLSSQIASRQKSYDYKKSDHEHLPGRSLLSPFNSRASAKFGVTRISTQRLYHDPQHSLCRETFQRLDLCAQAEESFHDFHNVAVLCRRELLRAEELTCWNSYLPGTDMSALSMRARVTKGTSPGPVITLQVVFSF